MRLRTPGVTPVEFFRWPLRADAEPRIQVNARAQTASDRTMCSGNAHTIKLNLYLPNGLIAERPAFVLKTRLSVIRETHKSANRILAIRVNQAKDWAISPRNPINVGGAIFRESAGNSRVGASPHKKRTKRKKRTKNSKSRKFLP